MNQKQYDKIDLKIFDTREEMGEFAAKEAVDTIIELLSKKAEINCVFAAAPSQNDFLKSLLESKKVEWNRVNAFHMDEYIGFEIGAPCSFSRFLKQKIFDLVPFKTVNILNGMENPEQECARYTKLLLENPIDITFMGIGENGHIAFNDPSVADFNDTESVKKVFLEESCRIQQVNDGCFPTIEDVPTHALTLTIPALVRSDYIFCIVPTNNKAQAIKNALTGEIDAFKCPASILRKTNNVKMYIDKAAASELY